MTSSSSAFDYATPYDIMTGLWVVIASMYTPEGEYLHSVPSRVGVRWKRVTASCISGRMKRAGSRRY